MKQMLSETAWRVSRRDGLSLEELLAPRVATEQHFTRIGHSYRHGRLYREFEHRVSRPLLRTALQVAGVYGRGMRNAEEPIVRSVPLLFPELAPALEGFQILHLSDFHIEGTPGLVEPLAEHLADLRPDLCVFTGDYRFEDFGSCEPVYPLMRRIVSAIRSRCGVFGILGNHDAAEMTAPLESLGIRMLINEAVEIEGAEAPLWVAGVDDPFDYRCHDLERALGPVPADSFTVLLAHAPEIYREASAAGVDLYLSGHTHGGQIRLPGIGAIRQNARCPKSYAFGAWSHGDMQGYTSAGLGCSGLPVRYGCPPEIALLELTSGCPAA